MKKTIDDSHERWNNQPDTNNIIWNHYNEVVSRRVVHDCIHREDMTFVELYQKLALKRVECEWMKQYVTTQKIQNITPEIIDEISRNSLFLSFPEHFGNFIAGNSSEPNILSWGEAISKLAFKRQDIKFTGGMGLSLIYPGSGLDISFDLRHPQGYALNRLENDFQTMRSTTNLFEFLISASRSMYMLSNYIPIERGSAAVNSWIVDKIAQEKFNAPSSIRPFLYDWMAFFDTPEQYTQYFMMATAVNYLKSLQKVEGLEEFEEKLLNLMQENPHVLKNAEAREAIWNELKDIIMKLDEKDFSTPEMKHLREIAAGNLLFRKRSNRLDNIIEIIANHETSEIVALLSQTDRDYLTQLFTLEFYLGQVYISQFGTRDEENLHEKIADLQFLLNNMNIDKVEDLSLELVLANQSTKEYAEKQKEFQAIHDVIMKNPIVKWGFISIDTLHAFTKLLDISKGMEEKVALALKNGLSIHALNRFINNHDITPKDLELLTSNAALLLYKVNPYRSIDTLSMETPEKTQMNLLSLVAKEYCNEHLEPITNENIRLCLLNHLDPNLLKYVKLSELVSDTEIETKTKLLSAYLENDMPTLDHISNMVVTLQEEIAEHNHKINLKDSYGFFSTKAGKQMISYIGLEIEMEGDVQTLDRDMKEHVTMLVTYCENAYELLGVNQDASTAQITKAFRGMAIKHHSDKNANADKEFMQYLIIAHKVLTNPAGRQSYDEALSFYNRPDVK